MKKFIVILSLLLISCQKDYIDETTIPSFFDKDNQELSTNQIIDFELPKDGIYFLLFVDLQGNLIARERFTGIEGLNTRTIYVGLLEQDEVYLMLYNGNDNKLQEVKLKLN